MTSCDANMCFQFLILVCAFLVFQNMAHAAMLHECWKFPLVLPNFSSGGETTALLWISSARFYTQMRVLVVVNWWSSWIVELMDCCGRCWCFVHQLSWYLLMFSDHSPYFSNAPCPSCHSSVVLARNCSMLHAATCAQWCLSKTCSLAS